MQQRIPQEKLLLLRSTITAERGEHVDALRELNRPRPVPIPQGEGYSQCYSQPREV